MYCQFSAATNTHTPFFSSNACRHTYPVCAVVLAGTIEEEKKETSKKNKKKIPRVPSDNIVFFFFLALCVCVCVCQKNI